MVIFVCLLLVQLFIAGQANVLPRIVNGHLAKERQFPYVVQVESHVHNTSVVSHCGGSIVANNWVLTAAHCTENADSVTLYYGSIQKGEDLRMNISVEDNVFPHPQYKSVSGDVINDIALIRTEWVKFSVHIQSVSLPPYPKDGYVGEWAIVAGWGDLYDKHGGSDRLFWAPLQVVDESVCQHVYGKSFKGVLCATSDVEQSVCGGDSGGPLVLENKLIGIVSFGTTTCENGDPLGFADVSRYLGWIQHVSGVTP